MQIKGGVKVNGMRVEILLALLVAEPIWLNLGCELVVTSVCDGKHSPKSLHYAGQAVDLRTRDMHLDQRHAALAALQDALPDDYDVVLESDHMHVEYQPRGSNHGI